VAPSPATTTTKRGTLTPTQIKEIGMFLYALESEPDTTDWQEQLAEDIMWYVGDHFSLYDHGMRVNDVKKQLRDIRLRVNYKVPLEPDQQRLWAEFNAFWDNEGSPFITEFSHKASAAAEQRDLEEEKAKGGESAARGKRGAAGVTVNASELGRLRQAARELAALKSAASATKPPANCTPWSEIQRRTFIAISSVRTKVPRVRSLSAARTIIPAGAPSTKRNEPLRPG
jgi:hypothetical protein